MSRELTIAFLALHLLARRPGCWPDMALEVAHAIADRQPPGQVIDDAEHIVAVAEEAVAELDRLTHGRLIP